MPWQDFVAQYLLAMTPAILLSLPRDIWPLFVNNGVERAIRQEEVELDILEARIRLSRMQPRRVG